LAIDLFHYLFGVANIGPRRSRRMQGLPPKDPEHYTHLFPNSPEGSPEGAVNNNVAFEIGSSTPLEGVNTSSKFVIECCTRSTFAPD
jgi:hypothetical protein